MSTQLRSIYLVLSFLLFCLFGCQRPDPVTPGIPGSVTPEVDIYACKFFKINKKKTIVDEFGRANGPYDGYSILIYFDTVYTNAGIVSTYKHTFDSQKFLAKRTSSVQSQQASSSTLNNQSETTYQYTAGKLTTALTSYTTSAGLAYNSSQRYTYDADGKVNKYVYTGADGSTDTQTFEGGILRSYRLVNGQGEVDDRTPYINSQGLVTQVDFTKGVYFSRFAYDPAGNPVRTEEWRQGKLDAYTINEYGQKSNQMSAVFADKGHPVLPDAFWSGANLIVKSAFYNTASGYSQLVKRSESDYAYTFNERGLVVKRVQTTRWFTLQGNVYQTEISDDQYLYRPCK